MGNDAHMSNGYAHKRTAIAHAHASQAFDQYLEEELESARPDVDNVKRLNAKIGVGLKLAEVHATLAIADALEQLLEVLGRAAGAVELGVPLSGDRLG